jgi:hypothetical protein
MAKLKHIHTREREAIERQVKGLDGLIASQIRRRDNPGLSRQVDDAADQIDAARKRKSALEVRLAEIELEIAKLDDAQEQEDIKRGDMIRQRTHDDAIFWFRRSFTSLALIHGAAFATMASGLLQSKSPQLTSKIVFVPLVLFAAGLVVAGIIPFLFYLGADKLDSTGDRSYEKIIRRLAHGLAAL